MRNYRRIGIERPTYQSPADAQTFADLLHEAKKQVLATQEEQEFLFKNRTYYIGPLTKHMEALNMFAGKLMGRDYEQCVLDYYAAPSGMANAQLFGESAERTQDILKNIRSTQQAITHISHQGTLGQDSGRRL